MRGTILGIAALFAASGCGGAELASHVEAHCRLVQTRVDAMAATDAPTAETLTPAATFRDLAFCVGARELPEAESSAAMALASEAVDSLALAEPDAARAHWKALAGILRDAAKFPLRR